MNRRPFGKLRTHHERPQWPVSDDYKTLTPSPQGNHVLTELPAQRSVIPAPPATSFLRKRESKLGFTHNLEKE